MLAQNPNFGLVAPRPPCSMLEDYIAQVRDTVFLSRLNIEPGDRGSWFLSNFHFQIVPTIKCRDCMNFFKILSRVSPKKMTNFFGKTSLIELLLTIDPIRSYPEAKSSLKNSVSLHILLSILYDYKLKKIQVKISLKTSFWTENWPVRHILSILTCIRNFSYHF